MKTRELSGTVHLKVILNLISKNLGLVVTFNVTLKANFLEFKRYTEIQSAQEISALRIIQTLVFRYSGYQS